MGSIAEGERNKMLDALVGRGAYSANAAFYVKLHTGDPGAAGTFDNAAMSLVYEYGQGIVNECTVRAYPRQYAAASGNLWRPREELSVQAGETEIVRAYFTEPGSDERVGADPATVALAGLTYSGAGLAASITNIDGMSCEISVVNSTGVARNWTAGRVVGFTLKTWDTVGRTRSDSASIAANGRRSETISSKWVNGGQWAKRIAQFRVNRFKDPRGEVLSIGGKYNSDAQFAGCWIGRKVNVVDDQLDHDGDYIIIGEDHNWQPGNNHDVRLYLELATTTKVSTTSI